MALAGHGALLTLKGVEPRDPQAVRAKTPAETANIWAVRKQWEEGEKRKYASLAPGGNLASECREALRSESINIFEKFLIFE